MELTVVLAGIPVPGPPFPAQPGLCGMLSAVLDGG